MTPHERHVVWKRARTRTDEHAREVTKLIEDSGLPYSDDASLRMDDPVTIRMFEIINSAEGRAAMIAATEKGLPAISGVDHRLSAELGVDYGGHNQATQTAGFLVAERVRQLGYRNSGRKGKLPERSIAKTAEIFVKKRVP